MRGGARKNHNNNDNDDHNDSGLDAVTPTNNITRTSALKKIS
jgi:hypothetical protein